VTDLARRRCGACGSDTPRLTAEQVREIVSEVPQWTLEGDSLVRDLKLKNFRAALDLLNRVGALAEAEGHHPDLTIHAWNRLRVQLSTHAIGGLSINDFILAAKIDQLTQE